MLNKTRYINILISCIVTALLLSSESLAQSISLGVKGGAPLTSAVDGVSRNPAAKKYVVGPMAEIRLPFSFAFEVDALYRRTGYDTTTGALGIIYGYRVRANSWEFPLLAKYYFGPAIVPVKFYATGGYAIRYLSGFDISTHAYGTDFNGMSVDSTSHTTSSQYFVRDNPVSGLVIGGGARFQIGHFAVSPEVRYTRWVGSTLDQEGPHGFSVQATNNQADVLIGVTF
jgi:hypothetical protein